MKKEDILDEVILVGSWCIYLYQDYFDNKANLPPLRTRDLDLLFPVPFKLNHNVDLFELIKDLGFIQDYKGEQGYIIFQHPELILEFIVPARGETTNKPFPIKQLKINAQPLRFMDIPFRAPIQVLFGDVKVRTPHPADFALHKLLIAERRKKVEKTQKDINQAFAVLKALLEYKQGEGILDSYSAMPKTWQKTIFNKLLELEDETLLEKIKMLINK